MSKDKKLVNLIFACIVGALGVFSIYAFYSDQNRTLVIQPPAAAGTPADHPQLPENHPPLDYAKELIALEQMSRNDPGNAELKTRIGNIYYDMGQYQKAIEAYQQSLSLGPRNASIETDIATCLHYLGQHDKALETLENVLRYRPGFPQALFNKGIVLHAGKKDIKGAIAAWEELLRLNPDLPQRTALEQRINQLKSAAR